MKTHTLVGPFLLAVALAGVGCHYTRGMFGSAKPGPGTEIAAQVGSQAIPLSEVDAALKSELARIDMQLYQARKAKLGQLVETALISQKAKSLGISTEELVKREITDKIRQPTDATAKEYYQKFKAQIPGKYEDLAPRIKEALSSQATTARRNEFVASLRKENKVEIKINPPRVEVATAGGYEVGPKNAPITLIEYSDFQCPFCSRSQATVKQVLDEYEGKIHHVFMDFPLTSIHPMAMPAAVAGRCANEQGKFWEYHKVLFERQKDLSQENFKKWAGELGLDQAKFDACMGSKKFEAVVNQSVESGQKVGVTGTPGFFVNGIMINGAQPFDVFQEVIDGELERKG